MQVSRVSRVGNSVSSARVPVVHDTGPMGGMGVVTTRMASVGGGSILVSRPMVGMEWLDSTMVGVGGMDKTGRRRLSAWGMDVDSVRLCAWGALSTMPLHRAAILRWRPTHLLDGRRLAAAYLRRRV